MKEYSFLFDAAHPTAVCATVESYFSMTLLLINLHSSKQQVVSEDLEIKKGIRRDRKFTLVERNF
jgi:hypothetical protein